MNQTDFPATIRVDLEVKFNEGIMAVADTSYTRLLEVVPSTSNAKVEVFYGDLPRLRRKRGEKQPQKFNEYKFTLLGDAWELTTEYKREDLNRQQSPVNFLMNRASSLGTALEVSKQQEFFEFLRNGSSMKGFDGANLYDFSHVYKTSAGATLGVVQSNMHLGGSQLDTATMQLEQQYYAEIKSDLGKNLGLDLTDILVYQGSLNHKAAREISNSTYTVENSSSKGTFTENIFRGSFNIMTTTYGIGASEWISFSLKYPEFKPVKVLSETRNPGFDNPKFVSLGLNEESPESFNLGIVKLGYEAYFDFNPGYWFTTRLHGSSAYTFTPSDSENQRVIYPNA